LLSLTPTTPRQSSFDAAVFVPPAVVGEYPILVGVCNAVLSLFNSLRILAPVSLYPSTRTSLQDMLTGIQRACDAYMDGIPDSEEARRFRKAFAGMRDSLVRGLDRGVYGGVLESTTLSPSEDLAISESQGNGK